MKKFIEKRCLLIIALLMISICLPLAVSAEETTSEVVIAQGTCGSDMTWEVTEDGTLTISGSGTMLDFSSYAPWESYEIKKVIIEDGVTSIGKRAFNRCSKIVEVVIPDSVTSIGGYAFDNCISLTEVVIPDSVTAIEGFTFCNCSSVTEIVIPEGVTYIGEYAFENCRSLTKVAIPEGVTSIETGVFTNCISLTEVVIPDEVTTIKNSAFRDCESLKAVEIPESVVFIDILVFYGCKALTEVVIPYDVTSVRAYAFAFCTNLESITIPNNETWLTAEALKGCKKVTVKANPGSQAYKVAMDNDIKFSCIRHELVEIPAVPATCTNPGSTAGAYCSVCGEVTAVQEETPAKGHSFDLKYDQTNHWEECSCSEIQHKEKHSFNDWTTTKEASETETGLKERSCTVCHYNETARIPMIGAAAYGDSNGDEKINVKDAALVLQYSNKKITEEGLDLIASDVNDDGKVNVKDASMILQYANKKIEIK